MGATDFKCDRELFRAVGNNNSQSKWSRRNTLLRRLAKRSELENKDFVVLAYEFIDSLVNLLPTVTSGPQRGQSRSSKAATVRRYIEYKPQGSAGSQSTAPPTQNGKGSRRFDCGYEFFVPVMWLIRNWSELVKRHRQIDPIQKHVLRILMIRCWLWYFHQAVKTPNQLLFSSAIKDLGVDLNQVSTKLDPTLITHFNDRDLKHLIPAYILLLSLNRIDDSLERIKIQLQDYCSQVPIKLQELKDRLQEKICEQSRLNTILEEIRAGVEATENHLVQIGMNSTIRHQHRAYEGLPEKLTALQTEERVTQNELHNLSDEISQIETEITKVPIDLSKAQTSLRDLEEVVTDTRVIIDSADGLSRRMGDQFRHFTQIVMSQFSTTKWVEKVKLAEDHAQASVCIAELDDALKQPLPF
jgi:prefoldin subunit 5